MVHFVGVMYFTYAGDPLIHTMFPDIDIVEKIGSGPGPEKSVLPGCVQYVFGVVSSLKH